MPGQVTSDDGTPIAVTRSGSGRPLVIVHGGINRGDDWRRVAESLSAGFECWVIDRRGRGGSGHTAPYALAREVEDVAAVVRAAGLDALLFGHSFGAVCALEAALRHPVARLIVYEPPLAPRGDGVSATFQAHLDAGRPELALRGFLIDQTGTPAAALAMLEASPMWGRMIEVAPTFPREANALESELGDPQRYAALAMPVLALLGEHTSPPLRESTTLLQAIVPGLRVATLAGQGHAAHRSAPRLLADAIAAFVRAADG